MTIPSSVPSNIYRPGAFHTFVFSESGVGLVPVAKRVALVGMISASGTLAAATPTQVFDALEADTLCGIGSELALMARQAFATMRFLGAGPEIWLVAIAAPAGAAATETITITGTAAESGELILAIAGRPISVGIADGDANTTAAAALETEIDDMVRELPVTAGVAAGVVTCTHVTLGANGNDVDYAVVRVPAGLSVALAQSLAGSGTVDITAALDSLVDKDYDGIAIANHASADITDATAHTAAQWLYNQKRYRWIFMGETGSVSTATTLAAAAVDKTIVLTSCEDMPSLPGEVAAAMAVAAFSQSRPNYNHDGVELPLYPPPAASAYTNSEIESLLSGGCTPLTPTVGGRVKIERLVTTDPAQLDLALSKTSAELARQIDLGYVAGFSQENITDEVLDRVRDMVIDKHRSAERLKWIRNVDEFLDQIQVEEAEAPAGRILVNDPHRVAGLLHQAEFRHVQYL